MGAATDQSIFQISSESKGKQSYLRLRVSQNQIGIIYRVTGVLFVHGWNIDEAVAETTSEGQIQDLFLVSHPDYSDMPEDVLDEIRSDLHEMFVDNLPVVQYLSRYPERLDSLRKSQKVQEPEISVFRSEVSDSTILDVQTGDRPGILFEISQILFLFGIDILSFKAFTEGNKIRDTFLLRMENGGDVESQFQFSRLKKALKAIL